TPRFSEPQRRGRPRREPLRRCAVELGEERRRLFEVIRPNLEQLLTGPLPEPLGEPTMVRSPSRLREAAVGDLADENVLEAIGVLAADRRARLGQDELAQEQVIEQRL